MLYAPAVCENCCAVFASTEVIPENDDQPASYRRWAGPCPRCGSRGAIPEWTFQFYATASIATDQATLEQLRCVIQSLRESPGPGSGRTLSTTINSLTNQLTGPWRGVDLELRQVTADQRAAKLTFLRWIVDRAPHVGHGMREPEATQISNEPSYLDKPSGSLGAQLDSLDRRGIAVIEPGIRRAS